MHKKKRRVEAGKSKRILFQGSFIAFFATVSVSIIPNDTVAISDGRMFDKFKLMAMTNHFSATEGAAHRPAYQGDIIVDSITVGDNVRFFYIGAAYIKH